MEKLPLSLSQKLKQRLEANAFRSLPIPNDCIDFSSNDYLGLSRSEVVYERTLEFLEQRKIKRNGATGSRLISGNHPLYNEVEEYVATFHLAESALIFNSGYDANVGLFSSVPQKGDIVLYDEYIHASIRDGLRLSAAKSYKFRHNDISDLEKLIKRHRNNSEEVYIAVESVFSMDGDLTPLEEMVSMSEMYNCRLIIDEAHALGVIGTKGEGLAQHLNLQDKIFARVMTFGKGLGCHGAAILGSEDLKQYLVNFARSFIYTTALPPHSLATLFTAYKYINTEGNSEILKLRAHIDFFTAQVKKQNLDALFIPSGSAIHCAVIPGNEKVKQISDVLQQEGFNVKPILSPTVPQGQERLRICLHSYNTKDEIESLVTTLYRALQ